MRNTHWLRITALSSTNSLNVFEIVLFAFQFLSIHFILHIQLFLQVARIA